ncbi:MAG: hypothetical protein EBS56_08175 [Planctomycetia bacterium]|nr:hypothetical protein [Planctomycetia bacterium]
MAVMAVMAVAVLVATAGAAEQPANDPDRPADATWTERFRLAAEGLEWSDEHVRHDWRLQRRPGSDTWRILDPLEASVVAGDEATCRAEFTRLETAGRIPAVTGDAVIVLHGLGENRASMRPLVAHLRDRLDAAVMTVGYASPRAGIDDHGAALGRVVAGLPRTGRISFVGHSLGNIVVRRWMSLAPPDDLARVHRMVMLGAPNQGSDLARMAARVWLLTALSHGAARDLVLHWPEISKSLAVPACEFGIVAGGKGDGRGYSTLLEGDDDAVVRVAETRLDGARDFLLLPVNHAAMMKNPAVQQATSSFLETGRFAVPAGAAAGEPTVDE